MMPTVSDKRPRVSFAVGSDGPQRPHICHPAVSQPSRCDNATAITVSMPLCGGWYEPGSGTCVVGVSFVVSGAMRRGAHEVNAVYGIVEIDVNYVDDEYGGARSGRARGRAGSVLTGGGAVTDVARDGSAAGVGGWLRDPRGRGAGVRDSVGKLGLGMDLEERAGHGE